jgi:carbamoyltransferase
VAEKSTYILGISCFYHDAAACLLKDGHIIAAAQEERFSRKKHDERFPNRAIAYCLKEAGIEVKDIDLVAFYDKPFLKFERLLETYLDHAPFGFRSFQKAMTTWLREKLWMPEVIKKELGYNGKIVFAEHHRSHAASAFFASPYDEAAILR